MKRNFDDGTGETPGYTPQGQRWDDYEYFVRSQAEAEAPKPPYQRESVEVVALRRRHDGWTAMRQRVFLSYLATTGSVAEAARAADISPRSAYRLRNNPKGAAFARAWESALMAAANRLTTIAFERAIVGTPRQIWRDGRLVAYSCIASDRMLMFLLRNLRPELFGDTTDAATRTAAVAAMQSDFTERMHALTDLDVDAELGDHDDYALEEPLTPANSA